MRFVLHPVPASRKAVFSLARRLGPYDAAAIIVSNVIGGRILFSPPQVADDVPHPWLFLATWLYVFPIGALAAVKGSERDLQRSASIGRGRADHRGGRPPGSAVCAAPIANLKSFSSCARVRMTGNPQLSRPFGGSFHAAFRSNRR